MSVEADVKTIVHEVSGVGEDLLKNDTKLANIMDDLNQEMAYLKVEDFFQLNRADPEWILTVGDLIDYAKMKKTAEGGEVYVNKILTVINAQFKVNLSKRAAAELTSFQELVNFIYNTTEIN